MATQNQKFPNNPQIQVIKSGKTGLFTNYIFKAIPLAFDESLSYYECLCGLLDYLKNVIIPTVNNNADAIAELQTLYNELRSYVENYFDNLDVQEEINNKLDEMVEDGTLQEIIASYLNSKAIFVYDTVNDMVNATNLINGSYAKTLGFYNKNDNGNALYKIRNITNNDVVDNMTIIAMNNTNLIAELINPINILQLGAKGDGVNDDTNYIKKAITIMTILDGLNKTYLISDNITIKSNMEIKNFNFIGNTNINGITGDTINNLNIHHCSFKKFNSAINLSCYWSRFDNIYFYNCNTCFDMINGTATGNLVENKFTNCDAQGTGCLLSIPSGNKMSDCFINNMNINCNDNTKNAISINTGSGHYIDGIHIYGITNNALVINNAYNTSINNVYIENYKNYAISIYSQLSTQLNNIIVNAKNNTNIINLEKTGVTYTNDYMYNLNNIMINGDNNITPTNVIYSTTSPLIQINNLSCNPNYKINGVYLSNNLHINRYFTDKKQEQLYIDNKQLKLQKIVYLNGTTKTITIPLEINAYLQRYINIKTFTTTYLGGTTLTTDENNILISRPNNDNIVITKTNNNMPISLSYDIDTKIITLIYTPSNNTIYGNLIITY